MEDPNPGLVATAKSSPGGLLLLLACLHPGWIATLFNSKCRKLHLNTMQTEQTEFPIRMFSCLDCDGTGTVYVVPRSPTSAMCHAAI